MSGIVIIGAGQAGASLAARLRVLDYEGPITLIGAEPVAPYQRPPLSKQYLLGEMTVDRLLLRAPEFYAEHGIDLHLGRQVEAIDRDAQRIVCADGTAIGYDQLALTTGAVPHRLPAAIGGALGGIHTVRTLADVDAMAPEFRPGAKVLVVGGGYIGLEAAAVAAKLGLVVTLVEMAPRILGRVAAPETADFFRALHHAHGVRMLEGTGLVRLTGDARVSAAELSDGQVIATDFVIFGGGVVPKTRLAEAAGLVIDNGIAADALGRTSDPLIWAAGDCASFPWNGRRIRLESVGNAIDQAESVAENMLGAEKPYVARPWFWSDQYDVKLQIAGLGTSHDRIVTRAGAGGALSFWYYRGATLCAVDAMNDPRAYMIGKRLIEAGAAPDPSLIADAGSDLKALLR